MCDGAWSGEKDKSRIPDMLKITEPTTSQHNRWALDQGRSPPVVFDARGVV